MTRTLQLLRVRRNIPTGRHFHVNLSSSQHHFVIPITCFRLLLEGEKIHYPNISDCATKTVATMFLNVYSRMGMALAIILALVSTSDAFWRMECRSRSGFAQIDPLVSFGEVSEHIHAIHGGSGKPALFDLPSSSFLYAHYASLRSWHINFLLRLKFCH